MNRVPYRLIKRMFWDGPCPTDQEWVALVEGRITEWRGYTRRAAMAKILERWSWQEIREYALDMVPELLEDETLAHVNIKPIRMKYERLGRFLYTKSIPSRMG